MKKYQIYIYDYTPPSTARLLNNIQTKYIYIYTLFNGRLNRGHHIDQLLGGGLHIT